jgi:hypothetical protein
MSLKEQKQYIQYLLNGDIEDAKKFALYQKNNITVWDSNSSFFKLLPHYLTMTMIQNNNDSWKDAVRLVIQLAHDNGFETVNGNSRENQMSLLHAYIMGYGLAQNKRSNEKIMDDLRDLYKLGWRPQKITSEMIKANKSKNEWTQSAINELGFALLAKMPKIMIEALVKVFPIDEPAHASGMTLMQYGASQVMADFMGKVAKLGGDVYLAGNSEFHTISAKDMLRSPTLFTERYKWSQRQEDKDLLNVNDQNMWNGKIHGLISKLKMDKEFFDLQKEKDDRDNKLKESKENNPITDKPSSPHDAPVLKKKSRRQMIHD